MNEKINSGSSSPEEGELTVAQEQPLSAEKSWLEKWEGRSKFVLTAVGVITAIGGAFFADHLTEKLSTASLLSQREQAETQLRATMFNNLMERIVSRAETKKPDPERMVLLAQLLALNFDEHFEFKPLLISLQSDLRSLQKEAAQEDSTDSVGRPLAIQKQLDEMESVARRIVDRQIDTLRAVVRVQGDRYRNGQAKDISISNLFFKKAGYRDRPVLVSLECNAIDRSSYYSLAQTDTARKIIEGNGWDMTNSQEKPAFFTHQGISQCITVTSPDQKTSPEKAYVVEVSVLAFDPETKTVMVAVSVDGGGLNSLGLVYEFEVTPFDFPLTDNTAIDANHRFSIVQKHSDEDEIWLQLVWFPEGYITERERPMDYGEMRRALGVEKEKKKWYEFWVK